MDLQTSAFSGSASRWRAKGMIARHLSERKAEEKSESTIMRMQQRDFNAEEYGAGYLLLYIFIFVSLIGYITNA